MKPIKSIHNTKDVSTVKMVITFVLLVIAIVSYIAINKYIGSDPADTEKDIVEKTGDDNLTDADAITLAQEKYYIAVATVTNTKTDINKIYNLVKTTDMILTDQALIDSLNAFGTKTYALNSSTAIISNYEEAITNNFTEEFINENIMAPNGFIGNVNNEHYIIKDKIDNYFFKEVELTLMSKSTEELHFQATNTKYDTSCVSTGQTIPSITCTETTQSEPIDFRLVKDGKNWKVTEITLVTQ